MSLTPRLIYYYQTFLPLAQLLNSPNCDKVTHIHVAAFHFGINEDHSPYIHMNNYPPTDARFTGVWAELKEAHDKGVKLVLMLGGAGDAYQVMFSNYKVYYELLKDTLYQFPCIDGIDLDIEEEVSIDDVKRLISDIEHDFGKDFIIAMAPIQDSLQSDIPGMGGFIYKDLYTSNVGSLIHYFNGQFYFNYSTDSYDQCIKNGYPPNKVVMGMISSQDFENTQKVATELVKKYKNFGGVYNWEYFSSPPHNQTDPSLWARIMAKILGLSKEGAGKEGVWKRSIRPWIEYFFSYM
jgi:hypothetical protein